MSNDSTLSWVPLVLRTRQSYINPIILKPAYKQTLEELKDHLLPEELDSIDIFPIADESQSSFIIKKNDGAAIFFDIGQSMILKTAFAATYSLRPQDLLFYVFLSAASLHVSKSDQFFTDKLGDCTTPTYEGEPTVNKALLDNAQGTLSVYLKPEYQSLYNLVFDSTIIAHEFYHHHVQLKGHIPAIFEPIDSNYLQFVELVFSDLSVTSLDDLPKEIQDKLERERLGRRNHNLDNRKKISEEMACDYYAMKKTLELFVSNQTSNLDYSGIKAFVAIHSIVFNFHLLHLAFLERASFYQKNDPTVDFEDSMSLFNIRRVAIGVLTSELVAEELAGYDPAKKDLISANLQQFQNELYIEMGNDLIQPCIIRLGSCFKLIEDHFPKNERPEPTPINDVDERLYLSALKNRLNPYVISEMLERF